VNPYAEQVRTWWSSLEPQQRRNLVFAVAFTGAVVLGASWWSQYVPYRTVLNSPTPYELVQVTAALEAEGITVVMGPRGEIMVPQNKLGTASAVIWSSRQGQTEELQDPFPTPAEFSAHQTRRKESDLARMISGIDGVSRAEVAVVPATESSLIGGGRPASASVMLHLRPGYTPSDAVVQGVVNIVANAVERLKPDRVAVTDNRGNPLSGGSAGSAGAVSSALLEYRGQQEAMLVAKVEAQLDRVFGSHQHFAVSGSVEIDTSTSQVTSSKFDAGQGAPVQIENIENTTDAQGKANSGAPPGADANLPERQLAATGGPGGESKNSASTREIQKLQYPSIEEVVSRPAGGVVRQSVSVMVDAAFVEKLKAATPPMDGAQLEKTLKASVGAVVGLDEKRGDVVEVVVIPFTVDPTVAEAADQMPMADTVERFLPYALSGMAILMAFALLRPVVKFALTPIAKNDSPKAAIDDDEADLADRLADLINGYRPADAKIVSDLVDKETQSGAQVIANWIPNKKAS
jgi:flagellar M-ring protein FliF